MELPPAVRALLDQPCPATVITAGESGSPQATVVWIEQRGDAVAFFSDLNSVKVRNLRQRPQATILVIDPEQEFEPGARCYVTISGAATIAELPDTTFPDRLAQRYMNAETFPHRGNYCEVVVTAERIGGSGPGTGTAAGWSR